MPTVERDGVSIYYEVAGSGPAVVLGHSFLCSGEMWGPQIDDLAARFKVINADARGHGRSGPLSTNFDLYDMVDDVVAVLDDAGVDRAVWAGLSIGGMVAMRAALTYPERIAGLVLLDTHAGSETAYKKIKYRAMGLGVRALGVRPFLSEISKLMFGKTTLRRNPELVAEWKERFAATDVPSMLRGVGALVRRDSVVDSLPRIDVPTLVIVGDEDASLPPPYSEAIASAIPAATLAVVPECGHLSSLEQPDSVTRAMLGFLDAHAR